MFSLIRYSRWSIQEAVVRAWICWSMGLAASVLVMPTRAAVPGDCEHNRQTIYNLLGVNVQPANVQIGQYYWKLVDLAFCDPFIGGGKVNIFYQVKNESGQLIANQACTANFGTTNVTIMTKVPPDWGDYAMTGGNWCPDWLGGGGHGPYNAWVNGAPSDSVNGMGLPCNQHISFYCTWQYTLKTPPTTGSMTGTVTDAANQPVRGVTLALTPGSLTGTTGPDGKYLIEDIAPGGYSVKAEKLGFISQTKPNQQVVVGQTTTVDFQLASSRGTVSGTVSAAGGGTIQGAVVKLNPGGYSGVSGDNGVYTIVRVPAGTYEAVAWAPARVESTTTGHVVSPGQTTTANFSLSPKAGRVAHIVYDFNDGYFNDGNDRYCNAIKIGIGNQTYRQATSSSRIRAPYAGSNSSQELAYTTTDDNFYSFINSKDPVTGHQDITLTQLAINRGWEPINPVYPITYFVYVRGFNAATDPDDTAAYWRQRLAVHKPDFDSGAAEMDWTFVNNDTWQVLKTTVTGLYGNQNQWITFESLYPKFYGNATSGQQSWMVWENFSIEYTPQGVGDTTPPGPCSNVAAYTNARGVRLSWQNPTTSDFTGALIRFRTDTFPTGPFDGTLLVDKANAPATSDAYTHRGGVPGQTYYYAIFAHDAALNYAEAATGQGVAPPVQPGDFDGDGDVDQSDFGRFQLCINGSGQVQSDPTCVGALLDDDPDVDQDDFGRFQICMSGPNKPANPNCAD